MIRSTNLLRDYQEEMIARVREAWEHHRSVMVQMPTGTGKTHVLAAIVNRVVSDRAGKVLVVAHRIELISQISDTLTSFGITHDGLGGTDFSSVVVASIQTVTRRLERMELEPDLVIIDEAHHALAKTYRVLWERWPKARFLGLTATPCRMNRTGFTDLFDVLLPSWSIATFIGKGVLSAFDYVSIYPNSAEQRLIASLAKRGADGDYQVKEMDAVLNRRQSIERLYRSLKAYADGRRGIVYAITIEHARRIAEYYSGQGVSAAAIDSHTPREERKRLVERFKAGDLMVLVNVDVFSEGFDCPAVEFVQLARPTLSLAKYLQQVGRGLRKSGGKKACMLIDNVGLYRVFGLPVMPWDWESMFRGECAGRGVTPTVVSTHAACSRQEMEEPESETGVGWVVSHEDLLSRLDEWKVALPRERHEPALRAWQDKATGLWGLKRGRKVGTEAIYIRVFDIQEDWAAVRFGDHTCGLVDASGQVVWKKESCGPMKFARNHFLVVREQDGAERYLDLYSWQLYDSKPEVRRCGEVEVLKVQHRCYSRTRKVYVSYNDFGRVLLTNRGFYLSVFESPERNYCLLPGDYERFYSFRRLLPDGSIVVEDGSGRLFHVADGLEKVPVDGLEAVERLAEGIQQRLEAEEEAKKRKILEDYQQAVPYCMGSKWGLKVGNRLTVPPVYRTVRVPVGKYCVVEKNYGQWGLIAIDGSVLIEPKYPEITLGEDGVVTVTSVTGKRDVYNIKV